MEYVAFALILLVALALLYRRSRATGDAIDPRGTAPSFGQAKDDGLFHGAIFGRSPLDAVGKRGEIRSPRAASREEGHGKDGGG